MKAVQSGNRQRLQHESENVVNTLMYILQIVRFIYGRQIISGGNTHRKS